MLVKSLIQLTSLNSGDRLSPAYVSFSFSALNYSFGSFYLRLLTELIHSRQEISVFDIGICDSAYCIIYTRCVVKKLNCCDNGMDAKEVDHKKGKEDDKTDPVDHGSSSISLPSVKGFMNEGSATVPKKGKDGGSNEGDSSHSKRSAGLHLMDEFRRAIWDNQRAEDLIAQAANYPIEAWQKAILWAFASGQTRFLSHFLQQAPSDLKGLLETALDADRFTALHRAVVAGQVQIIEMVISLEHFQPSEIFQILHARTPDGWTALHLAVAAGDENMVTALMNAYDKIALPGDTEWDFADNFWMTPLHYAVVGKLEAIVRLILGWATFQRHLNATDYFMRTAAHMASSHSGASLDILVTNRKVDLNAVDCCLYTPLHWAVFVGATEAVRCLIAQASDRTIRTLEDDIDGWPVLQIAIENETVDRKVGKDIERLLLTSPEVKDDVERLYRDRQVYVDATNAILVGAALISSISFSGFLQPPAGDGTAVAHREVRVFWACNGLSFFFSMATVMAGAGAVLPLEDVYIGKAVGKIRIGLAVTSFLLIVSVLFILASFAAAGFANLTSYDHLQSSMIITTSIGAVICIVILAWFLGKLYKVFPDWRRFMKSVTGILHHAMMKRGRLNLVEFQTEMKNAATRAEGHMQNMHMSIPPELKTLTMTSVVFDLEKASKTEMHVRQQAKDLMGMMGNPTHWEHHVREKVLESRITPFEKTYRKARLKESDSGELQNPTLNMLILNNVGPRGVHHWIEPFPSSFCRPHCLKKDKERWNQIQSRVLAHKKPKLEAESLNFEFGRLDFENWVPAGKPSECTRSAESSVP